LRPLRKAQFGQTLRYFEILTSSFTRVNSGVKISKSLDFDQIHTFRSRLIITILNKEREKETIYSWCNVKTASAAAAIVEVDC
jgi:hypothetical protein